MATTKKTAPHVAALARVSELDEQEQAARALRDKARAHLADLTARNQSGDHTVTGLDLMTARAEVEAADGLADHAARMVADARADAAAAIAEQTSREVRESIVLLDLAKVRQTATEAFGAALTGLNDSLIQRNAASDAAGRALADAGIAEGRRINGIRYLTARRFEGGPAVGGFNVEVQTEAGLVWLAGSGEKRDTDRERRVMLAEVLDDVLRPYGLQTQQRKIQSAV